MRIRMNEKQRRDLVYAEVDGSLLFLPRKVAVELAAFWEALAYSDTWGEFRGRVSRSRYVEVVKYWLGLDGKLAPDAYPADDESFPGTKFPCIADSLYPEWPAQEMLNWLPESVLDSPHAKVRYSLHNGEYLHINPKREKRILALLRADGYQASKDERLVFCAKGGAPPFRSDLPIADLMKALSSPNDDLRSAAIRALAEMGPAALPALLHGLQQGDERTRSGCASALGRVRPITEDAVRGLADALQDESGDVAQSAGYSLGALGAEARSALPALIRAAAHHPAWRGREGAGWGISKLGPAASEAVPTLIQLLKDPHRNVQLRAVWALGLIGPSAESAVPALIEAFKLPDADAGWIGNALAGIGQNGLDALQALETSDDRRLRERATLIRDFLMRTR